MKTTKKQLKEIAELEKKVAEVCDTKKTTEVTLNDKGVIINKETGKPHFEYIDIDEMEKISKEKISNEKKSREVVVSLSFGTSAPSLKYQLKEQGFELPNRLVKDAEMIRTHLLALKDIRILNSKQLLKCFKKLSKKISQRVVNSLIQKDETAIHIKTKSSN